MAATKKPSDDKVKQSVYLTEEVLAQLRAEGDRLDRSISWLLERAWKMARASIKTLPSVRDPEDTP